jgi:hypothetical protein
MIERKCLECHTWNKDEDYCNSCNAPLSPKALDLVRSEKMALEEANRPRTLLEKYKTKAENSKYLIVRFSFYMIYSVLLIIGGFAAFLAWLTAMANV